MENDTVQRMNRKSRINKPLLINIKIKLMRRKQSNQLEKAGIKVTANATLVPYTFSFLVIRRALCTMCKMTYLRL